MLAEASFSIANHVFKFWTRKIAAAAQQNKVLVSSERNINSRSSPSVGVENLKNSRIRICWNALEPQREYSEAPRGVQAIL